MPETETIVMRGRSVLPLLAVAALVVALAPPRAQTEARTHPVVERLAGTYDNVRADGGEAIIAAAIEAGTSSMRRVRRKVARRRLRAVNPSVSSVTLGPNRAGALVLYEGSRENRTPRLGVFAANRSADGGKVDVMHEVVGRTIHERYRQKDGTAVNVFRLSEDGRELSLEVTIESSQLPGPIRYRLEFRRAR